MTGNDVRWLAVTSRVVRGLLWIVVLFPTTARAQSISPAVVEYREAARGKFELANKTLYPLHVVLDPRGFRVEESGSLIDEPLDTTDIHLRLSAMSFTIPPLQSYAVYYEASASRYPAWFQIISAISGGRTPEGLSVRIEMPHVVYLLQRHPLARTDVSIRGLTYDSVAHRVLIDVENAGSALGRILGTEVTDGSGTRAVGPALPLFPNSRRRIEIPWDHPQSAERVILRFAGFSVEERRRSASN